MIVACKSGTIREFPGKPDSARRQLLAQLAAGFFIGVKECQDRLVASSEHTSRRYSMPNRILREGINSSLKVDALSVHAEVFYRRLMSAVDDFGRHEGMPLLLLAKLYPLRVHKIKEAEVIKWIDEAVKCNLIKLYCTNGKVYVEMSEFRQQKRAIDSKCPAPAQQMLCKCYADAKQMLITCVAHAHLDGGVCVVVDEGVCVDDSCTEPQSDSMPEIIFLFPIVGGVRTEWPLLASKINEYQESFPGVDVVATCRVARQWCIDNPKKRKTETGMPKFLSTWLSREQNNLRSTQNGQFNQRISAAQSRENANASAFDVVESVIRSENVTANDWGGTQTPLLIEAAGSIHPVRR